MKNDINCLNNSVQTYSVINLKWVRTFDSKTYGVNLDDISFSWCHVGDFRLGDLDIWQLDPLRIFFGSVTNCIVAENRVRWRLPMYHHSIACIADIFFNANIPRWMRH